MSPLSFTHRKHALNCHRMKPALFSVLCEIKEKTGKVFWAKPFPDPIWHAYHHGPREPRSRHVGRRPVTFEVVLGPKFSDSVRTQFLSLNWLLLFAREIHLRFSYVTLMTKGCHQSIGFSHCQLFLDRHLPGLKKMGLGARGRRNSCRVCLGLWVFFYQLLLLWYLHDTTNKITYCQATSWKYKIVSSLNCKLVLLNAFSQNWYKYWL